MKRKIILNLAMSLDGYIADINGGFEWINGYEDCNLDTKNKFDFNEFLNQIDIVVMGKKCYDQNLHKAYKDKKVYVATSSDLKNYDNIHFIKGDIVNIIKKEKEKEGKHIYLFGGGIVLDTFIKENIIDEYIIGIIPTILGSGKPLFLGKNEKINLKLENYFIDNGIVILKYSKK
ncbi:dihydrofolate reductase family protein [[Clostridium] colinum]|uniref:dihydrofolate reductase family protein n=1 Tax=[Clostridium] colinum TaxID=36835 RepID=UPI002025119D|nr:dihydrofolate reductase family protein [[Clostridium] colinum]